MLSSIEQRKQHFVYLSIIIYYRKCTQGDIIYLLVHCTCIYPCLIIPYILSPKSQYTCKYCVTITDQLPHAIRWHETDSSLSGLRFPR